MTFPIFKKLPILILTVCLGATAMNGCALLGNESRSADDRRLVIPSSPPVPSAFHPSGTGGYTRNADGVPISGGAPNPTVVSTYVIRSYTAWYETGESTIAAEVLPSLDWLLENAHTTDGVAKYSFPFDFDDFDCTAGWSSGLSNA